MLISDGLMHLLLYGCKNVACNESVPEGSKLVALVQQKSKSKLFPRSDVQ
jgi:hypothetical protein